jgi:hypothetical protein
MSNAGALRRGKTGDGQGATSTASGMGTTVESSSLRSTTVLATSAVGGAVGCAALAVATLALCGASGAGGAVLSVSVLGASGVALVSPTAAAVGSDTVAAPSRMGGASVEVDATDDVAHVPDVVGVVAVPPSVVLPDGATASVAPGVHEMSAAADDVTVAGSGLTAVVVAAVTASVLTAVVVAAVAASVLTALVVAAVEDDDGSVDEVELAVSDLVAVTSEGVSDAPAVVSAICVLTVAVVVSIAAETAAVSAKGTAVSTACSGGAGTSSALAGATQVDVEATPTTKTAVQRISRSGPRH